MYTQYARHLFSSIDMWSDVSVERVTRSQRKSGGISDLVAADTGVGSKQSTPAGFEECYTRLFDPLVRMAYLQTRSFHVAQELVQDSFANMHGKWARVTDPDAYVRRSVVNACTSYHRREGRVTVGLEGIDEPSTVDREPDEMFEMMGSLAKRQRMALILRFHEDQSEAAIAETLGCRVSTVASLIHRGLASLRDEMEKRPAVS